MNKPKDLQTPFFGRRAELEKLNRLLKKDTASIAVIKGRRRVGKSRLAKEFSAPYTTYSFVGYPPEPGVTAAKQRKAFIDQMQRYFPIPNIQKLKNWGDILWHLADQTKHGRIILIFDEINWMGSKDPTFMGSLKTIWDEQFKHNPELILILSGSMSAWIEKNILSSTAFVGRISLNITLQELPLYECAHFWKSKEALVSAYEKFKILAVVGGIPRYLEEINPHISADENIRRLCFETEGMLFDEFEKIFSDLFDTKGEIYHKIIERLANGKANIEELADFLRVGKGGNLSSHLRALKISGFIAQDYTWNLKDGTVSKLAYYRLKDNYSRFYLKYIRPNKEKIETGVLKKLPAWESIMGLQFENLVLNNAPTIWSILGIKPEDIIFANPFFQRKTADQEGCQIDYLIQTRFNVLYLCEIKFSHEPLTRDVIAEVQEKIGRLLRPRYCSVLPVLIHVNGITDAVAETDFFAHNIDFGDLLRSPA